MKLGLEELSIIVEGLRTRVKQLANTVGTVSTTLTSTTNSLISLSNTTKMKAGDYGFTFFGAGYITDSKKQLIVTIPINQVIGSLTPRSVTLSEILIVQGGNTVYKTADGLEALEIVPSTAANALHCGVRIDLYKSSSGSHVAINSNAVNNDACGIFLRGTINFA